MQNLQPTYTKVRLYFQDVDNSWHQKILSPFVDHIKKRGVSAICEFETTDKSSVVEIVALRDVIHQGVIPTIEEMLPGIFVTMEAVCAFTTRNEFKHQLYL